MDKKTAGETMAILSENFPDKPALVYATPYQLLVAVILSAQCTDERVNKVTVDLFAEHGSPETMLKLSEEELGEKIYSCGLYRSKAKHILSATADIVDRFGGEVPSSPEDLRSLAGVGRKTANVVYSVAFGGDAFAVDTHVFRVSNRLGLAAADDVVKTELQLMDIVEKPLWKKAHHYLIYLGRSYCKAAKPDCAHCPVGALCEKHFKPRGKGA